MKPIGPTPSGFTARQGELAIAGRTAGELIAEYGPTPLFVYDSKLIAERVADLRAAMPSELAINYAIKANPLSALVQTMSELVDGFDIASGGELRLVRDAGISAERISFAGPGKDDDELRTAIVEGVTLNCESGGETKRILTVASQTDRQPKVALRINPPFELRGSGMKMGGGAKPFGVDPERVPDLVRLLQEQRADWRGFHIYAGSQSLDADAIVEAQRNTIELAARLAESCGAAPPHCNIGGGFGIPYFAGDEPLDIEKIGRKLDRALAERSPLLRDTRFTIELGRYLVGEAGVYLTRVLDRKESQGQIFLVTDGGLHHQLAASGNFGTVVRRNYPVAIANRFDAPSVEEATIVGRLCTPLDRLADQAFLPHAEVGDIVAVFCAGAYGASASPAYFLGHGPAREALV